MHKTEIEINDVTDTALWIAAYRASESKRPDALFKDPYAELLIGENGARLATHTQGSRMTAWSVVIRTLIIDQFITQIISNPNRPVDTIINIGAGLDTRPYRMNLPSALNWIEADFSKLIDLKNEKLKAASASCHLERLAVDLKNPIERNNFLKKACEQSNNCLVLTEGVVPYLTNDDAKSLAQDLYKQKAITTWITEYYSPEILNFLRTKKRLQQMENAPFLFYPDHWFHFFLDQGWKEKETKYFGIESRKFGRTPPTPGWLKSSQYSPLMINEMTDRFLGYSIYEKV